MYHTRGVDAVATVTELRSKTSEILEFARKSDRGVLIQKNNEPYAVLLSYEKYLELIGEKPEKIAQSTKKRRRKASKESQMPA